MHILAMCHVLLHIIALWIAAATGEPGVQHLVDLRPPIPVRMGTLTVGRPIELTAFEGDALELPCETTEEDVVAWYRGDETTPLWVSEERFTAIKVSGVETLVVDPVSLNDTKLFYCRSSDAIIYYDITVQASVELPDDFDQMDLSLQLHLSGLQTGDQLADVFGAFSDDEELNAAEGLGSSAPHNSALLMHPGYPQTSEPFDAVSLRGGPKALVEARNAVCAPDLRTVELDVPHMTGVFVTPKCVRLHRCGGCCMGPLIECRASQTKNITLKLTGVSKKQLHGSSDRNSLIRSRYVKRRGAGRRRRVPVRRSAVLVTALNHTKCACQCRVQECGPLHTHDQCRCHCKNQDSKRECLAQSTSHRWDEDMCKCRCLAEKRCSTSLFFDHRSCSCVSASELGALARVSTGGGSRRASLVSSDLTSFGGVIFGL